MTRKKTKFIHEGRFAAEVSIDLIIDDTPEAITISGWFQVKP